MPTGERTWWFQPTDRRWSVDDDPSVDFHEGMSVSTVGETADCVIAPPCPADLPNRWRAGSSRERYRMEHHATHVLMTGGRDGEAMIGELLVRVLQQVVEVAIGRGWDAFFVPLLKLFVVGDRRPNGYGKCLYGSARESVERDETEYIATLNNYPILLLAGVVDHDEAPVGRADVDRPIDAADSPW